MKIIKPTTKPELPELADVDCYYNLKRCVETAQEALAEAQNYVRPEGKIWTELDKALAVLDAMEFDDGGEMVT